MGKRPRIAYILLAILGIGVPFFVVFKNIYPDIRSSLFDRTEFGLGFNPVNLAGEDYFIVSLVTHYPFNQTNLSLKLGQQGQRAMPVKISLARDYMANVYPIGEEINDEAQLRELLFDGNPDGVANGSVYSQGISVFSVSRGKFYPIVSPEVFESLGYHWENVEPMQSTDYARLEEGEKMNFLAVHPDGTLLRTKEGKFYLVWQQRRRPIANDEVIEKVWKTAYWIDVADDDVSYFSTKELTVSSSGKLKANFEYDAASVNALGNVYIIKTQPNIAAQVSSGKSEFQTSFTLDKNFLKFSLGQIKNKLYMRYAGFLL